MISRRPSSQDGRDNRKAKQTKAKSVDESSPQPPEDPDERLIFEAHRNGNIFVTSIIANEVGIGEENAGQTAEEKEAPAGGKGGKGGKASSPAGNKKGNRKQSAVTTISPKGKHGKSSLSTRPGSKYANLDLY